MLTPVSQKSISAAACTHILYLCLHTECLLKFNTFNVLYALSVASVPACRSCIWMLWHTASYPLLSAIASPSITRRCIPPAMFSHVLGHADYDILMAAGGDGTINQVVNELVDQDAPKETCLAVIPLGTANDFATSLTIHDDNLVQAMQTAVHGIHCLIHLCSQPTTFTPTLITS